MPITEESFLALFEKRRPSVKLFSELLEPLPPETREKYYQYACFLFLNRFDKMTVWYQIFLKNLMKHDLQRFSDYLMKTSGFPNLQCEVKRFKPVVQLFHMLTADKENVNFSFELISFFAKLTFNSNLKISSLESYIRNYQFTPETFFEFAEYVKIYF